MIEDELRKSPSVVNTPSQPAKVITSINESVLKKFLRVLKDNQPFMKVREIAQVLVDTDGGDENVWVTKLSRRNKKLKELDKIVKYQVGSSRTNIFWGSPNWIENGEIKQGFEINPDTLSEKGSNPLADYNL